MTKRAAMELKPNCIVPASNGRLGQVGPDNQIESAEANEQGANELPMPNALVPLAHDQVQPSRNGHGRCDIQAGFADLDALHMNMRHYARMYWDLQKVRIGLSNRIKGAERDGLESSAMNPALDALKLAEKNESGVHNHLRRLARDHFMADWIESQPGIGPEGFAGLIGATGPLDRFATVSKLWKYCGLHVTPEGKGAKRTTGQSWSHTDCTFQHLAKCKKDCATNHHPNCVPDGVGTAYTPQARVLCRQLADSFIKLTGKHGPACAEDCERVHKRCPWRDDYDRMRARYDLTHEDWTEAHRHNAALRYAAKCFLRDLWIAWHQRRATGALLPIARLPADDQQTPGRMLPIADLSADPVPV